MKNFYTHNRWGVATVMLLSAATGLSAQSIHLSGTILHNNQPVSGVSIKQLNNKASTASTKDGTFAIILQGDYPSIVIDDARFERQIIPIKSTAPIVINLKEKVNAIEDVVLNTGYYKVKSKNYTGSIAKVTSKDIENQPVNNVLSAVQGRMAGVSIMQNSGTPGGGYQIQIRGRNSLRITSSDDGNQPLYIVDGMVLGEETSSSLGGLAIATGRINPLNAINPTDIESIEILKDADATAIYGSRGANGVILITTKKGKAGKLALNLTSSLGFSSMLSRLKMMNSQQYLSMRQQAYANSNTPIPANAYDINGTWDTSRDTNWQKELLGNTATNTDTNLSLRGGSLTTSFLLSLGHSEQNTVLGNDFKYYKNTLNSSISHKSPNSKFLINQSTLLSQQHNNLVKSDITRQALLLVPNSPQLYNSDGTLNWENNTFTNPLAAYNATYGYNNLQAISNINTLYQLTKNWAIKVNAGLNFQDFDETALTPNTIYNPSLGITSANSLSSQNNQRRWAFNLEPQLNWSLNKTNHKIEALLGATYQKEVNQQSGFSGAGFQSNAFINNPAAATNKAILNKINTHYKYAAAFARINYQYKDRYILNLTGRRDGSSRFGPNNKYANFGAIGAAWIFAEEPFVKKANWLSSGKLRASYGTAGSDNIGDFQYLDTFVVGTNSYNNVTALQPSKLFNGNFSWEKTKKFETALELGAWNNRLTTSIAYYSHHSTNQLVGYQLPSITGFTSVLANLPATVQNWGWEFEIYAKPWNKDKFSWETSANLTIPKNKLLAFPGLEGSTYASIFEIGRSTSIVKLYQFEGIDPSTGKYKFTDFNNDGAISSAYDRKVIVDIGPRWFAGWSNKWQYKNWDAALLLQFVKQKNRNYNQTMPSPGGMSNQPIEVLNVWSASNTNGAYMPYTSAANPAHTTFQNSTASVSDASYLRVKNFEIAYNLQVPNTPISKMRIYLQGQNILTFTKYFGMDPEFGPVSGFMPPLKTYAIGTSITF